MKHSYAFRVLFNATKITSYFNQSHGFKTELKAEAFRIQVPIKTLDTIGPTR